MKDICILSDFDGTITKKDGLYAFISLYAQEGWREFETLWAQGKINSKECLQKEFDYIENFSEELVENYIKTVETDDYFKEFYSYIRKNGIDFFVVSDGVDYFIERIFENIGIKDVKIISNHLEFNQNGYTLTFPNEDKTCKKSSGTCKCKVMSEMKKLYKKVIYIGDGISDYCVCDKADILYAKGKLINYCKQNNIKHIGFESFKDIIITNFCS